MMVHRTPDGVLITGKSLRLLSIAGGLLGTILIGVIGAVRFVDRSRDTVPRQEFRDHVRADSEFHAEQKIHATFQDSVIAQQGRDGHSLTCYVFRNPLPFCNDRLGFPIRP